VWCTVFVKTLFCLSESEPPTQEKKKMKKNDISQEKKDVQHCIVFTHFQKYQCSTTVTCLIKISFLTASSFMLGSQRKGTW
jgi:hypothetical protein